MDLTRCSTRVYDGLWWSGMVLIIGGGGGNRTRYHYCLDFHEILSKTMKNHVNSEPSLFLQNASSC
ncbi:hypothetical protein, partial [Legionella pneumophila]|uniref:hypothetical protein n=1 Tax=Legionella pneumophila TaxID=446 RepID=UPI001B7D7A3D